ncbi:hypothetical protein T484DRAFT_1765605 [Baffinella frigidus]|nr:hypothetical protein T484DRAFT_1765605 [Cryptophyta sp. CCMP2293]
MQCKKAILKILNMFEKAQLDYDVTLFFIELERQIYLIDEADAGTTPNIFRGSPNSSPRKGSRSGSLLEFAALSPLARRSVAARVVPEEEGGRKIDANAFFYKIIEKNREHRLDLDGLIEQSQPGLLNVILFDLIQYQDSELCEAVLSLVTSRSQHRIEFCDTLRRTQLLDRRRFQPAKLRRYLLPESDAPEAAQAVRQHFREKGLKALDLAAVKLADTRCAAQRSADQIMAVIADTLSALETFESEVPGKSER